MEDTSFFTLHSLFKMLVRRCGYPVVDAAAYSEEGDAGCTDGECHLAVNVALECWQWVV